MQLPRNAARRLRADFHEILGFGGGLVAARRDDDPDLRKRHASRLEFVEHEWQDIGRGRRPRNVVNDDDRIAACPRKFAQ
jgi:hypothetical protein